MATKRITSAKKMLTDLLDGVELGQYDSKTITINTGTFSCKFPGRYTREELMKRASAIDRIGHQRKENGGLKVQSAMVFILANRAIAANVKISYHSGYRGSIYYGNDDSGYYAYNGKERLEKVDFTQSDYDYAMEVLRINNN